MSNVVQFGGGTLGAIPPDNVLQGAVGRMKDVVVIGVDLDGDFYFAQSGRSATADELAVVVMWLERAKHRLIAMVDGDG